MNKGLEEKYWTILQVFIFFLYSSNIKQKMDLSLVIKKYQKCSPQRIFFLLIIIIIEELAALPDWGGHQ